MHLLVVVPARLGSTRIPHKPLCLLAGEPLIAAVARRIQSLSLDATIAVAADDERVLEAVSHLDVDAVLTSPAHTSGTERVAEVAARPEYAGFDTILNIQGDEPFVTRAAAGGALDRIARGDPIGTTAVPLEPGQGALTDPARVKVAVSDSGRAVGFWRVGPWRHSLEGSVEILQHVGVYAYTRRALVEWAALPASASECEERLEQLRPLAHGIPIGVTRVPGPAWPSIDTMADLALAEEYLVGTSSGVDR